MFFYTIKPVKLNVDIFHHQLKNIHPKKGGCLMLNLTPYLLIFFLSLCVVIYCYLFADTKFKICWLTSDYNISETSNNQKKQASATKKKYNNFFQGGEFGSLDHPVPWQNDHRLRLLVLPLTFCDQRWYPGQLETCATHIFHFSKMVQ